MKNVLVYLIIISIFSLVVIAQPECTDGMIGSINGGESFECHLTKCETLEVEIAIDPWQNITDIVKEYTLNPECINVNPFPSESTFYPDTIKYLCDCIDDYVFSLTTLFNSDGIYYIDFTQNYTEIIDDTATGGGGGGGGGSVHTYANVPAPAPIVTPPIAPTVPTPPVAPTAPAAAPPTAPAGPTGMAAITGAVIGALNNKPVKGVGIMLLILLIGLVIYYIYRKYKK